MKSRVVVFFFLMVLLGWNGQSGASEPSTADSLGSAGTVHDAVAVIVNPLNPIKSLSMDQLRGIFSHKLPYWHLLGGNHELSVRTLIGSEESAVLQAFRQRVLMQEPFEGCETLKRDEEVLKGVGGDEAAIGIVSLSSLGDRKGVRVIAVDMEKADLNNPEYPLLVP
jgi:phosphate transport system substrate-binding protein